MTDWTHQNPASASWRPSIGFYVFADYVDDDYVDGDKSSDTDWASVASQQTAWS